MLLTKYSLWASLRSMSVFYLVYIPIVILNYAIATIAISNKSATTFQFTGFDLSTSIFMFVLGLALFMENFKMAMANSLTRKNVFTAAIATAVPLAIFMTIVDKIIMLISSLALKSSTLFFMIYSSKYSAESITLQGTLTSMLWEAALMITLFMIGYLIGLIFYKLDKIGKLLFSFIAFVVPILGFPVIDNLIWGGKLFPMVIAFILKVLGITTCQPSMAIITFLVVSLIATAITYILIARVKIKKS